MRKRTRAVLLSVAGLAAVAAAATAVANHPGGGGTRFTATLTGAAECSAPGVCGVGDPDGSGTATLRLNSGQQEICFTTTVANVDPATAAHIHRAPAGRPGPVVVPLTPPVGSGCVHASRALIKEIRSNPEGFYVNVHNPAFPGGAVRGQLRKGHS